MNQEQLLAEHQSAITEITKGGGWACVVMEWSPEFIGLRQALGSDVSRPVFEFPRENNDFDPKVFLLTRRGLVRVQ